MGIYVSLSGLFIICCTIGLSKIVLIISGLPISSCCILDWRSMKVPELAPRASRPDSPPIWFSPNGVWRTSAGRRAGPSGSGFGGALIT